MAASQLDGICGNKCNLRVNISVQVSTRYAVAKNEPGQETSLLQANTQHEHAPLVFAQSVVVELPSTPTTSSSSSSIRSRRLLRSALLSTSASRNGGEP